MNNKLFTFIGFCEKSQNTVKGTYSIKQTNKKLHCIIICSTAGENAQKDIKNYAEYHNIPLIKITDFRVEDLVHRGNCKVIGITDKNLAQAIIQSINLGGGVLV